MDKKEEANKTCDKCGKPLYFCNNKLLLSSPPKREVSCENNHKVYVNT